MAQTPYEILGVDSKASQEDIKAAYRKLAKKLHPDLNPGNKAAESRFKEITAAYSLIDSPELRAKYDQGQIDERAAREVYERQGPYYHQTQQGGGKYSSQFEGFDEDVFASIFDRMGRNGPAARPREEIYHLSISFKDSVLGAERELHFPNGKNIQVKIPPGVTTGTKLRFASKGESGGDIYVQLHVLPAANFKRVGKDIETEVTVPFEIAILGGEFKVPTVDGVILLKVPAQIAKEQKMRVAGKGVALKEGRGDLIVKLNIAMPEKVDEEFKAAVAAWKQRQVASAAVKESL